MKNKIIIVSVILVLIAATLVITFALVDINKDNVKVNIGTGVREGVKIEKVDFTQSDKQFLPDSGLFVDDNAVSQKIVGKFKLSLSGIDKCTYSITKLVMIIENKEVEYSSFVGIEIYDGDTLIPANGYLLSDVEYSVSAKYLKLREDESYQPYMGGKQIIVEIEITAAK